MASRPKLSSFDSPICWPCAPASIFCIHPNIYKNTYVCIFFLTAKSSPVGGKINGKNKSLKIGTPPQIIQSVGTLRPLFVYHSPDWIKEVSKGDLDPQVVGMVRGGHQLVPPVDHLGQQDVYGVADVEVEGGLHML